MLFDTEQTGAGTCVVERISSFSPLAKSETRDRHPKKPVLDVRAEWAAYQNRLLNGPGFILSMSSSLDKVYLPKPLSRQRDEFTGRLRATTIKNRDELCSAVETLVAWCDDHGVAMMDI
jgi:hypothetical protein